MPSAITNPSADAPAPTLGTADVQRLDMGFDPADSAGTITDEVALAAGESIHDFSSVSGPPTAFRATVVDAGGRGQGWALAGRRVWVIRYSGADLEIPGPSVPAPATARSHTARYAYVFLDAVSGQLLLTTLSDMSHEGGSASRAWSTRHGRSRVPGSGRRMTEHRSGGTRCPSGTTNPTEAHGNGSEFGPARNAIPLDSRDRWLSTVLSLIWRSVPISPLTRPSATSSMIWRSRGDGDRGASRAVQIALAGNTVPPLAALRREPRRGGTAAARRHGSGGAFLRHERHLLEIHGRGVGEERLNR